MGSMVGLAGCNRTCPVLVVEALERSFLSVFDPSGDHFAIGSRARGLHNHDIAFVDQGVDHRITFDSQCIRSIALGNIWG